MQESKEEARKRWAVLPEKERLLEMISHGFNPWQEVEAERIKREVIIEADNVLRESLSSIANSEQALRTVINDMKKEKTVLRSSSPSDTIVPPQEAYEHNF